MPNTVSVREVGLRDGLQMVKSLMPTNTKIDWCQKQAAAGFVEIEVTSFVPPKVIPQFSDAADVLHGAHQIEGLLASVLVPNAKGATLAMDAGAKKITYVLSASEAHSKANTNRSTEEGIAIARDIIGERKTRNLEENIELSCIIATSFGCSIQGAVDPKSVIAIAEELCAMGIGEISLADTVGHADPNAVSTLFRDVHTACGSTPLAAHFHDTRGMGLANVVAALDTGIRRFDASLGGLGGCPFAPGATGNIATEDCVHMLERLGLDTGVDMDALMDVRLALLDWLPNEPLDGKLLCAKPIPY